MTYALHEGLFEGTHAGCVISNFFTLIYEKYEYTI